MTHMGPRGNTDNGHVRTPQLHQEHRSRHDLNLVVTMALCEVKESQIKLGPPLAWSSGSNMAPGGDPEPRHPCGLWSQTMEINTNVGHSKTIDPNMTLSSGPDDPGS